MDIRRLMKRMLSALSPILATTLVSGLGTVASGQAAGPLPLPVSLPDWQKLAIPDGAVWQDSIWEPEVPGSSRGNLLAADRGGRLYVNNGPKLHIASLGGTAWVTVEKAKSPYLDPRRALAAGAQATVQWGEWRSRDGGATWDSTADWFEYRSFGILGDGSRLRGSGYDAIDRSSGNSEAWDRVHMGRTYGYITRFATKDSRVVFALPWYDALLCSLDSGRTWTWAQEFLREKNLTGRTIRAIEFAGTNGTPLLLALRKNADGSGNLLARLHVFYTSLDTLEDAVLPDSAITALHADGDGTIWLGTSGQGVWTAPAGTRTFRACNGGLGNLQVSSLAATADGRLYAMTRDGVYLARSEAVGLPRPRPVRASNPGGGRSDGIGLLLPGLPGNRQPFSGRGLPRIRILADGRQVPAPGGSMNTTP